MHKDLDKDLDYVPEIILFVGWRPLNDRHVAVGIGCSKREDYAVRGGLRKNFGFRRMSEVCAMYLVV
jgi:hypothetical protein